MAMRPNTTRRTGFDGKTSAGIGADNTLNNHASSSSLGDLNLHRTNVIEKNSDNEEYRTRVKKRKRESTSRQDRESTSRQDRESTPQQDREKTVESLAFDLGESPVYYSPG